jgi:hypothetical protein
MKSGTILVECMVYCLASLILMYMVTTLCVMTYTTTHRALISNSHIIAAHIALTRFCKDQRTKTSWKFREGKWLRTEHGHTTVMVDRLTNVQTLGNEIIISGPGFEIKRVIS